MQIEARARGAPGFVSFKTFAAGDGERVSIVVFADTVSHEAWRDDEEHQQAQRLGRSDFISSTRIFVCQVRGQRHFQADDPI